MAYILSIETATTTCSVALHKEGVLIADRIVHEDRSHSKVLNKLILETLEEAGVQLSQVEAMAVSKGPGSYTGLRIGVATVKGICFANDIPLIAINTLQTIASAIDIGKYEKNTQICSMIDARRMEVYLNFYDANYKPLKETAAVIMEEGIYDSKLLEEKIVFCGNGMNKCKSLLKSKNASFEEGIIPLAKNMGQLAYEKFSANELESIAYFEPFYLKEFRTTPSKK